MTNFVLSLRDAAVIFLSTVGYIGMIPAIPATSLSFIVAIVYFFCPVPWLPVTIFGIALLIGLIVAERARVLFKTHDPRCVVIDELAGMSIALIGIPLNAWPIAAGFCFFRFFDIVKPFGIKKIDQMRHPSGIILDDVLAGIYANLCVRLILLIF